jgi:hypothetical protein
MDIKIEKTENKLETYTPYHKDFVSGAKRLGGKWQSSAKCWTFDRRDETAVINLISNVYGYTGDNGGERVTVRISTTKEGYFRSDARESLRLGPVSIARAYGRDSGATMADNVVVIKGDGFISDGSRKNWHVCTEKETVFEIRDLPRGTADKIIEAAKDEPYIASAEIVDQSVDKDALMAEKENLLKRLTEIENLLKTL